MYVKVLDHSRNQTAIHYAVDDSQLVRSGRVRVETDPSEWRWSDAETQLQVAGDAFDGRCLSSDDVAGYYDRSHDEGSERTHIPYWEVSWVQFCKPGETQTTLIASTAKIYLMDASGSTIDRAGGRR